MFCLAAQSAVFDCDNWMVRGGGWVEGRHNTYQVAYVGFVSVITRKMYKTQANNLKNKSAIRIRKPVNT